MDEEDEDESYEIDYRNGLELRYHFGEPGNYIGVKKRKGVRKTTYQAHISITKRKGNTRRQYGLGSFGSAEEAAIAIARERLKEEGPSSPQGDRKPRTCAQPARSALVLTYSCLMLVALVVLPVVKTFPIKVACTAMRHLPAAAMPSAPAIVV